MCQYLSHWYHSARVSPFFPLFSTPIGFSTSWISRHCTLCLTASRHFLALSPSPATKKKQAERGWGFPKIKKIKKIDLYCLSFLYLLFQVSNRMKIIETKDLFSLFSFWGSRKIKKMNMFFFIFFIFFLRLQENKENKSLFSLFSFWGLRKIKKIKKQNLYFL